MLEIKGLDKNVALLVTKNPQCHQTTGIDHWNYGGSRNANDPCNAIDKLSPNHDNAAKATLKASHAISAL